jgi:cell division protein FtsW
MPAVRNRDGHGDGHGGARTRPPEGRRTTRRRIRPRRRPSGRPTAAFAALLGIVLTLNLVGLVMVLSASSVTSQAEYGSPWHYVARQAVWSVIGGIVLLGVQRVDYHRWRPWAGVGLVAVLLALALVLVPGVGVTANGSTRWLGRGSIAIQPSELAKLAMVMFVADLLGRRIHRMRDPAATLRPVLVVTTVVVALIMLQPNLGTTLVVVAIVVALLFVAGAPLHRLAVLASVGAALAAAAALAAPYRRARVFAYLDPWADPMNTGYQTLQAWAALAEGGISGVGVGAGRAKWGFLPFAHTDFIFAVIGEEFGLLGAVAVVLLFVGLGVLGVRTALRAPDALGMLLATGVTAWFVAQAFINIGAVVAVLPVTGVPLPFVSAGGSSLVASMAAAGLLANVARQASETTPGGRPAARVAAGGPGGGPRGGGGGRGGGPGGPPMPSGPSRTPRTARSSAPAPSSGPARSSGPGERQPAALADRPVPVGVARAAPSGRPAPSGRAAPSGPAAPSLPPAGAGSPTGAAAAPTGAAASPTGAAAAPTGGDGSVGSPIAG